jgi:putative aldouronate transport system permease protein
VLLLIEIESKKVKRKKLNQSYIFENLELYLLLLPMLILIFLFDYLPIGGIAIAFQDYSPAIGIFANEAKWVGFKHFINFINGQYFLRLLTNTFRLSFLQLVFGFWPPIILALLLNEIRALKFKKAIQTCSYMPYFISSVIVSGMVLSFINSEGIATKIVNIFLKDIKDISMTSRAFPVVYVVTNVWKSFGFSSILYMSTLASVNTELYEAARIDGATRMQQVLHISIPSITPVISIQLIIAIGGLLSTNTEMILLLYNSVIYDTADVFGTYVYRYGLLGGKYSFTTAVGLFTNIVNFILVFLANSISNHFLDFALW